MIKRIKWLVVTVLIVFIIIKGKAVYTNFFEYRQADKIYENIENLAGINFAGNDFANTNTADANLKYNSSDISTQKSGSDFFDDISECPANPDFGALGKINKDIIGWLYLPDTKLNYPVVKGTDNDYYLTHMFDDTKNSSGSIFVDYESDGNFDLYNTVIYGHHMKNGSMFAVLSKYRSQEWYEEHPVLWLVTPEKTLKLYVYSAYTADVSQDAWKMRFDSRDEYKTWLLKTKDLSEISTDISPDKDDSVITLSTCSYEFDNARFVVHATIDLIKGKGA